MQERQAGSGRVRRGASGAGLAGGLGAPRCARCGRRSSDRSLLDAVGVALCRPCLPRFERALDAWLDATSGASTEV